MNRYEIYIDNMPKLRREMRTVSRKCSQYNTAFYFAEVGETLKELEDQNGRKYYAKFVIVEAEGRAQINGWRFLASIDHQENGNVIRKAMDVEIPKWYYSCPVFCEHCRTKRSRTHAYLVQSISSGEIKMVGRNCLNDFTNGMSAEGIAAIMGMLETLASLDMIPIAMEVMPDHIHLLVDCKPQICFSDAIKVLKGNTARWLFIKHPEIKEWLWGGHLWNPSYFVATVSDRNLEQVKHYIDQQKTQ